MEEIRGGNGHALLATYDKENMISERGEKMSNKTFKLGVSNWEISFPDGKSVVFDALTEESTYFSADGKIKISLKSVTFNSDFISYFRNEETVVDIKQMFKLHNPIGEIVENMEYGYPTMKIKNMKVLSRSDEVTEVNIVFANK